jgi:hypothetical protein
MNITKLENININIDHLIREYRSCIVELLQGKVNPYVDIVVQKKFHLVRNNYVEPILSQMPYTKQIVEHCLSLHNHRDVTYRVLNPCTTYLWHYDKGQQCLHIPLLTNDGCFFIYEREHFSMPSGYVYLVNNGIPHTFCNSGPTERVHITFENL